MSGGFRVPDRVPAYVSYNKLQPCACDTRSRIQQACTGHYTSNVTGVDHSAADAASLLDCLQPVWAYTRCKDIEGAIGNMMGALVVPWSTQAVPYCVY